MRAVARGEEAALCLLVERHSAPLHAYLVRLCGDGAEAEDLLQESWLRVVRGASGFDPERRFRSWLYGIATHVARDRFRRSRARGGAHVPLPTTIAAAPSEPRSLARVDLRGRLAELPERLRQTLVLRYYEGMDEPEIAKTLGVARGTVKSRLHAAVAALRRSIAGAP
ncbi:ECF RNA polymerase sigma factor SigW [Myxococcaceae bacterium]|nr:ECF RNA polymerase sigma factor SigW [Myxococcaceae bacterium]